MGTYNFRWPVVALLLISLMGTVGFVTGCGTEEQSDKQLLSRADLERALKDYPPQASLSKKTLGDVLGKPVGSPVELEGNSLLSVIDSPTRDRMIFCEGMLYGSTKRSISATGYKLMYDMQGDRYTLFDLASDEDEKVDVAVQRPGRLADLKERLTRRYTRCRQRRTRLEAMAGMTDLSQSPEERRRALEALRSLGYTGGD